MKNILITTSTFGEFSSDPLELLAKTGFNYILNPHKRKISTLELKSLIETHQPIGIIAGTEEYSKEIFEKSKNLRCISRVGVGTDGIDSNLAELNKISIRITSSCISVAVAELTIGLIFSSLRNIPEHANLVAQNQWSKKMGALFSGKTIGLIGYGSIGRLVSKMLGNPPPM